MLTQWILRLFSDKSLSREVLRRNSLAWQSSTHFYKQFYAPPQADDLTYTEEEYAAAIEKQKAIQRKVRDQMLGDRFAWKPASTQQPSVDLALPLLSSGRVGDADPDTLSISEINHTGTPVIVPSQETDEISLPSIRPQDRGRYVRCVEPLTLHDQPILRLGHRYTISAVFGTSIALAEYPSETSNPNEFDMSRFELEEED